MSRNNTRVHERKKPLVQKLWFFQNLLATIQRTRGKIGRKMKEAQKRKINNNSVSILFAFFFLLIQECSFDKDWKATHLHVVFNGNMQVLTESACNRWFFTFNGAECSTPVDTTVYSEGKLNVKTTFEGYCAKAFKGNVKVGLNVGPCDGYTGGDARTGWGSVSRITVEEVEPPKES